MNVLDDITNFIFIAEEPQPSDLIFIPGNSSPEPMERAAALWRQGFAPVLCPSGRYSITKGRFDGPRGARDRYPGPYRTECEFLTDVGVKNGVPVEQILKEDRATYTMQNATFSRRLVDLQGLKIGRAILCCKSYHARRAYMYYQYAFPETELLVVPVDVMNINRANWFRTRRGIELVLGEVSRCGHQFPDLIPKLAAFYDSGK